MPISLAHHPTGEFPDCTHGQFYTWSGDQVPSCGMNSTTNALISLRLPCTASCCEVLAHVVRLVSEDENDWNLLPPMDRTACIDVAARGLYFNSIRGTHAGNGSPTQRATSHGVADRNTRSPNVDGVAHSGSSPSDARPHG